MSVSDSGPAAVAISSPPQASLAPAMAAGGLAVALTGAAAAHGANWRTPALALVGLGLGFTLFQSTFGFAGSFRAAIERRDFAGFRAQAIAIALASVVFFPLLAAGEVFGQPLNGYGSPVGVSFAVGAVLFGFGMQIGGGCASGTLFALGGGNARLLATLAFFVVGSAVGAAHLDFWRALPALPAATTQDILGWPVALALHLAIFAAIVRAVPAAKAEMRPAALPGPLIRPWPLAWGAVALAALNAATLVIAGRPWGETSGFTLWGSKIAAAFGAAPATWPYWRDNATALSASIFADITSVMDFGIILGAMIAAGLSGRFAPRLDGGVRPWLGASLGGVLMGYGARLSDGCNIGAYFSALASGALSAWAWVAFAFLGSYLGLRARGLFALG